jgi:hypothetical protein
LPFKSQKTGLSGFRQNMWLLPLNWARPANKKHEAKQLTAEIGLPLLDQ